MGWCLDYLDWTRVVGGGVVGGGVVGGGVVVVSGW